MQMWNPWLKVEPCKLYGNVVALTGEIRPCILYNQHRINQMCIEGTSLEIGVQNRLILQIKMPPLRVFSKSWDRGLSVCLWNWHPLWVSVQIPAAPLLIQLLLEAWKKKKQKAQILGSLPSIWDMWKKLLDSGSRLWFGSVLGSKPVDGRSLYVSLSLNIPFK